jgi:hypothetical protein
MSTSDNYIPTCTNVYILMQFARRTTLITKLEFKLGHPVWLINVCISVSLCVYLRIKCRFGESHECMNGISNAHCSESAGSDSYNMCFTYASHTCMTFTNTIFNPYNCGIQTFNYI